MTVDLFIDLIYGLFRLLKENIQPPVDLEMATIYSAILFANLGEYIVEFMH